MKNIMSKETNENEVVYASFTARIIATVIDVVLSALILYPLISLTYKYIGIEKPAINQDMAHKMTYTELIDVTMQAMPSLIFETVILTVVIIILWVYKAATPGKMLLNMKIVDAKTLQKPGIIQSLVRYFAYIPALLPLYLGFIWIYFDKRKQGFHDKIAGTIVIKVKKQDK